MDRWINGQLIATIVMPIGNDISINILFGASARPGFQNLEFIPVFENELVVLSMVSGGILFIGIFFEELVVVEFGVVFLLICRYLIVAVVCGGVYISLNRIYRV